MTTVPITISTSLPPSAACNGFVFAVDETNQTLPTFMIWNASTNTLLVSPIMSTGIGQYPVHLKYGKGSYIDDYLDVVVDVKTF